jgi:hypothetical protein
MRDPSENARNFSQISSTKKKIKVTLEKSPCVLYYFTFTFLAMLQKTMIQKTNNYKEKSK